MTIMTDEYNGWTNRETWALDVVLSNDYDLYKLTQATVADAIAGAFTEDPDMPDTGVLHNVMHAIEMLWREQTDPEEGRVSFKQALANMREVGSAWRVDWQAIAQYWIDSDREDNPVTKCYSDHDEDIRTKGDCDYCGGTS